MYRTHKIQLLIALLLTVVLGYVFDFKTLDLSLELILFNLSLLIIYSLFLANLTQDKELCEELKYNIDKEINSKSNLGVIVTYFILGIGMCILSIVFSLLFKALSKLQFAYLIQIFNLYLLYAGILIFKFLVIFIIHRQIYR